MSHIDSRSQPLQILDLPDEILQLILGYCCSDEDLGFLLWSCRVITTKDQFCHECYHCTLCHGPYTDIPRMAPHPTPLQGSQTQTVATTTPVTTTYADCSIAATSTPSQQGLGRRRRRRLPGGIGTDHGSMGGLDGHGNWSLSGVDLGYLFTGVRRCPWNNHQRWRHEHGSSNSRNDRIHVRPLPLLPSSRTWAFFGKAAAAAAATTAGVMKSSRTIGPGNGDPVVHVPGAQVGMMNNNNNGTRAMVKAGMGSESRPAGGHSDQHNATQSAAAAATTITNDTTCLSVLPQSSREGESQSQQHLRQGVVCSPLPHHHHHRHRTGKGCMMGENHNDGARSVPPARTKSLSSTYSLPFSLTSLGSASLCPTIEHAITDANVAEATTTSAGADAKHSYLVTPVPADTATSSSCRVGNLHSCFSAQASSQTFLPQQQQQQQQHHVDQGQDAIGSSLVELSMPFQLLLVCKRFGNAVVQSLWDRVVFHGHDPIQVQALLSTLRVLEGACTLSDRSVALGAGRKTNNSGMEHNRRNHDGDTRASTLYFSSKRSSLIYHNRRSDPCQLSASSRKAHPGNLPHITTTRTTTVTDPVSALGPVQKSLSPASSFADLTTGDEGVTDRIDQSRPTHWTYSQLVRRVVLNFAHAQSSRSMLIETLECLRESCDLNPWSPGYRSLDLHASEKMHNSGSAQDVQARRRSSSTSLGASVLESTPAMDFDQLFGWGSGFSNLSYLRLRGGFVDNQLLNAITKGMQTRQQALAGHHKSRLAQLFLGPGSFTDSAIEKFIDVAGSSLEVVMVTSCVDIGGGSLARFLTQCPKLRVLGFYRSLARDEDLFQGLGIRSEEKAETTMVSSSPSSGPTIVSSAVPTPPLLQQETRKAIVAPLERLELSTMIKMSSKAIATIVQGVSQSLKHLTVDSKHFNEEFLEEIFTAASSAVNFEGLQQLESLSFKDRSFHQKQQQRQQHRSSSGVAAHLPLSSDRSHRQRSHWLGDTTTEEWIHHGGSPVDDHFHNVRSSMGHSRASAPEARVQYQVSAYLLHGRNLLDRICGRRPMTPGPIDLTSEESYEGMLERFAVNPGMVCRVVFRLSKLTSFTVLERDVVVEHGTWMRQKEKQDSDNMTLISTAALLTPSGDESEPIEDAKRWMGHMVGGSSSSVQEALTARAMSLTTLQVRWILILVAIITWVLVVINSGDSSDIHGREDPFGILPFLAK